jgi:hypothetical protein
MHGGTWRRLAAGLGAMLTSTAASGDCAVPLTDFQARGSTVGVVADATVEPAVVREAIAIWEGCANYGRGFPNFAAAIHGGRTVTVTREPRRGGVGQHLCGTFTGARIVLYDYWTDAAGAPRRCGSLAHNLAHELGHALGLDDAPAGSHCGGAIMAPLTVANLRSRAVTAEECQLVGQKWLTPGEQARVALLGESEPYRFLSARLQ